MPFLPIWLWGFNHNRRQCHENNEKNYPDFMGKSSLELYIDFCPSELLNPKKIKPNETFVASTCVVDSCANNSSAKLKKFVKVRGGERKIAYIKSIQQMVKNGELLFRSFCLVLNKGWHYGNGLLNLEGKMDARNQEKWDVSATAALMLVYFSVLYFLTMCIYHKKPLPSEVKVTMDRFPGNKTGLLHEMHAACYKDVIPTSFYKGRVIVDVLAEKEDPPALRIADMMARLHANSMILADPDEDVEEKIKRNPQGFTDEQYRDFAAFINYLVEEKRCLAVGTPTEVEKVCKEIWSRVGITY